MGGTEISLIRLNRPASIVVRMREPLDCLDLGVKVNQGDYLRNGRFEMKYLTWLMSNRLDIN